MAIFISKTTQIQNGRRYGYYILKANLWDAETKAVRQRYLASLGTTKTITVAKAKELIKRLRAKGFDVTLDDLRRVRGLKIVADP